MNYYKGVNDNFTAAQTDHQSGRPIVDHKNINNVLDNDKESFPNNSILSPRSNNESRTSNHPKVKRDLFRFKPNYNQKQLS